MQYIHTNSYFFDSISSVFFSCLHVFFIKHRRPFTAVSLKTIDFSLKRVEVRTILNRLVYWNVYVRFAIFDWQEKSLPRYNQNAINVKQEMGGIKMNLISLGPLFWCLKLTLYRQFKTPTKHEIIIHQNKQPMGIFYFSLNNYISPPTNRNLCAIWRSCCYIAYKEKCIVSIRKSNQYWYTQEMV